MRVWLEKRNRPHKEAGFHRSFYWCWLGPAYLTPHHGITAWPAEAAVAPTAPAVESVIAATSQEQVIAPAAGQTVGPAAAAEDVSA